MVPQTTGLKSVPNGPFWVTFAYGLEGPAISWFGWVCLGLAGPGWFGFFLVALSLVLVGLANGLLASWLEMCSKCTVLVYTRTNGLTVYVDIRHLH